MKLISAETLQKHTQTSGKRNQIDHILTPLLLAKGICGLQILDPQWSWKNNVLNYICILAIYLYFYIGTLHYLFTTDNYLLFAEALFTTIIGAHYPLKMLLFLLSQSVFRDVFATAKDTIFSIVQDISPEKSADLIKAVKKMVDALFFLVICPVFAYLPPALWYYFNGTKVSLSRTTTILLPVTSPYYELSLSLHVGYFIVVCFGLLLVDFWFVFFTHFLCEASDCAVSVLKIEKIKNENKLSYANRLNEGLRTFYSAHVKLMQFLNILNKMYKWPLLAPFAAVLGCTCIFLLVISEKPNWQIATIMLPVSVEIFAYNMLGEKVKTKANDMKMALLNFDWTSMNIKDRKNYYIILCYMNQEFGIRTAVGLDLSLLTLSSVYKGSYQTFAVLNTMKN